MKNFLDLLLIAFGSTLAVKGNTFLLSKNIDPFLSIALSAFLAVLIVQLSRYVLIELPLKVKFLRKRLDPRSKLEGAWLIRIDNLDDRPYSFAVVEYNPYSKNYTYYGTGFDQDGKIKATWRSIDFEIDLGKDEIVYLCEAQLADEDGEILKSFGTATFEKDENDRYTRGKGFFVDFGTKFLKRHFYLDRLTDKMASTLSVGPNVVSHDDMKILIRTPRVQER